MLQQIHYTFKADKKMNQKRCMWCGAIVPIDARLCPVIDCAKEFPPANPPPRAASLKRTNAIAISDDDDDSTGPGKSSGSALTAKGAAKVQAARKLADKHDAAKHAANKSKYSIGAASKKVAETFGVFLSLGGNYSLIQLNEGQKQFELKPDDKVPSYDDFFRSLARSVRGWKSNTKYEEDYGTNDIPRHAYPVFCPLGNTKNPPVEFEMLDDPNNTVRDLLNRMDEIKKGDGRVKWFIVFPATRIKVYNSEEESPGFD